MNLSRYFFALSTIAFLTLSSCEDDSEGLTENITVDLQIDLINNGQPVALNDTVLVGDYEMALKKFKLYLSKLELTDQDGKRVRFEEVALLDLSEPNSFNIRAEVPNRAYTEFHYGLGLDSTLNASDPTTFPDEHPLSSFQQMYWTMLKYRFFIVEGRSNWQDSLGSNDDVLNAYHVGTDSLYRPKTVLVNSVSNSSRANLDLRLRIDIADFFSGPFPVDLLDEPQTHSEPAKYEVARKLMDNLSFNLASSVSSY